MQKLKIGFFILINIVAIYLIGPHPEKPYFDEILPAVPSQISIDEYVSLPGDASLAVRFQSHVPAQAFFSIKKI